MSPLNDLRRRMQRELMWLVLLIVVVDAVAIGAYHLLGMEQRSGTPRLLFTIAWVVATLAVVVPRMQRMKAMRAEARRGHGRTRA
jgi:hypothetical protein